MKDSKKALSSSILSLVLCVVMLIGTTFAWFSDKISSGQNIIQSGNLDIEMYWTDDLESGEWFNVEDDKHNTIFNYDNWEPGYTDVKYIKIVNAGSLALNYELSIDPIGEVGKLAEVINVYYANEGVAIEKREDLTNLNAIGLLDSVLSGGSTANGTLLGKNQQSPLHKSGEIVVTLAMSMITTAGNEYQNKSIGDGFTITALATQAPFEEDSFGKDYDGGAEYPEIIRPSKGTVSVSPVDGKVPTGGVTIAADSVSAIVPEGVALEDGVDSLTLTVTPLEHTTSDVTVVNGEILIPVDVHIEGVAEDNTVPIIIDLGAILPKYLNMGNYTLIHVEESGNQLMECIAKDDDFTKHNQFKYDSDTGAVTVAMASFSEVALIADTQNAWQGSYDDSWYNTTETTFTITNADELYAFAKIVGGMADGIDIDDFDGKTVNLIQNIDLNGGKVTVDNKTKIFYPIGYYNNQEGIYDRDDAEVEGMEGVSSNVSSFSGTFNGNGHTITNFYQNTWEMFGDYNNGYSGTPNYYKDAMGLFGYVNGGTVENLTVDHFESDGEFTPTGVIAAYAADATFKNIAVTQCNPRVYNTGNGGIVGIGGNSSDTNELSMNFTNITVDNTNTISALWGSWDVACGGIMGMFRGNSSVNFTNCHAAAQIDVYNDVCGNYQYYWYRYSGMMIGSLRGRNIEKDGYNVPDLSGIKASECTVSFDEWNDYYYCELVDNSIASYTHDHQFSRLEQVYSVDANAMTYKATADSKDTNIPTEGKYNFVTLDGNGYETGNATCYHFVNGKVWNHVDAGFETFDLDGNGKLDDYKEDNAHIYLPFNQVFQGDGWGVKHIAIAGDEGSNLKDQGYEDLDIQILNRNSVEKFKTKFTGDFLYRVGNENTVSVGTLFAAKDGATINSSGVYVTIDKVDENSNVSGTYTANTTDWTKGTIQFSGNGKVKVTIQDYDYCAPTVIELEVVDAVNVTSATSATKNNVVLLNNCDFSSLEVSGGYTLYGNGFIMTCSKDSVASDMGYSFVTLNSGTLDNVQIVCPNYDYAALYKSNLTSSENRSETDSSGKTRYYNAKSGVMASGNSQILNSRISGGRASLNVSGGNVVVDNSRVELGAVASILVGSANSLTLRDTTLIQKPTASTYDSSKTLMGFSVLYLCDSEGKATPTTIEGGFIQQAWIDENDAQYVPSAGKDIVTAVLNETDYLHDIDGDGTNESLNLGFAYMPEDATKTVAEPNNITDNRSDKATVPYEMKDVKVKISILETTVYVYSYKNTNGTGDSFKTESDYVPNEYSDIITVTYSDAAEGLTQSKSYGTSGWVYELNVDLDKANGYALDFNKLSMTVNGVAVSDFKVNGNDKPTSLVSVTAGGTTYTLTATIDGKEYNASFKVIGTETSKESPSLVGTPSYGDGFGVANKYGGDWSGAAPVLDGITIKYWSVADSEYKEFALSSITFANTGKQNGTNNYWEYTHTNNDFTLKLTNTAVMHSNSGTYGMPVAGENGKLYFTIASSGGFVSTGTTSRSITIAYEFTDNNGGDTLKFSHTWSIPYSKDEQYNYSLFTSDGTLEKLKAGSDSSSGCVTPDTLITLADSSQVRVDSLTGNEQLLVWNMETGKLDSAPIMFVDSELEAEVEVIKLYFSDGTEVKVISEHGFWDYNLNKYVYLDRQAEQYIGHEFAKQNGNKLERVTLVDVVLENEVTTAWSPVTAGHLCYFVNGMLSMPGGVGGLFNIFDVDAETMTYDYEAMARDIETYGLFTYEELSQYADLSKEMFDAAGGQYLKVSIGKGNLTVEELVAMIERYGQFF